MDRKRIRCHFCHHLFYPDPRCKKPIACSKAGCQKARKYASDKRWRDSDSELLSDRQQVTRLWLANHPDYLREYRRSHPDYTERNRIKERLRRKKRTYRGPIDISALISAYPAEKQGNFFKLVPVIKSVDISAPIFVQRVDLYRQFSHSPPR